MLTEASIPPPAASSCGTYRGAHDPVFWSDNNGGEVNVWVADPSTAQIAGGPAGFIAAFVVSGPDGRVLAYGGDGPAKLFDRSGASIDIVADSLFLSDGQFAPAGDALVLSLRSGRVSSDAVIVGFDGTVIDTLPGVASAAWLRA